MRNRVRVWERVDRDAVFNWAAFLIWVALVVWFVFSVVQAYPAVTTVTNKYALPYYPTNLDLTQITNKYSEKIQLGGGPAIGTTQADDLTLEIYKAKTSATEGWNYLSVTGSTYQTDLDYYYERPGSFILRHYGYNIPTPQYDRWFVFGYFETNKYWLEDGKIVLQGDFEDGGTGGMLAIFVVVFVSMLYYGLIRLIKEHLLWRF